MIGAIATQTWRSTLRDGRFRLLAAVMVILALASGFTGWARDQVQATERVAAAEADQRNWLNQGAVNPHNAAHFGRWVPKPVAPLAFFDPGLEPQLGQLVRLEAHRQDPARSRPAEGSTALAAFAAVTPTFVLQTLIPLLVILIGFSVFSGDRSRILLRQELASGASSVALLGGRLLGLGGALLLVVVLPLAAVAVVLIAGGRVEVLPRLALAGLGYGLYLVVFLAVTLGVSALASNARTALVVLLACWTLSALLLPRLAPELAEQVVPSPTGPIFQAEVREEIEKGPTGHEPQDVRLEAYKQETLRRYGVATVEELPVSWEGLSLQFGERYSTEVYRRRYAELDRVYEAQATVTRVLAALSPTLAVRAWSASLAGTDQVAHQAFLKDAEDHRFTLVDFLNAEIARQPASVEVFDYKAGPDLWARAPRFAHDGPTIAEVIDRRWLDLLILAAWALVALAFAFIAAKRLRPA